MNGPDPVLPNVAQPYRFLTAYIAKTKGDTMNLKNIHEERHTFLNCDLSTFRNDLPNESIRNSVQTDDIFDIFPIS